MNQIKKLFFSIQLLLFLILYRAVLKCGAISKHFNGHFPIMANHPECSAGDYRSLYMKLSEASPLVSRLITYDFFTCMSPNTEWGSSGRLLARYMEMIGKNPELINEIYC